MRILILESDAATAEALEFALANAGFESSRAAGAQAGLGILAQEAHDAVIVAHPLSDQPAFDVCRGVRESRDVPVLFVTGCTREETVLRAFAAGVDDVMFKPVRLAELVARLGAILRRRGGHGSGDGASILERGPYRLDANRLEAHVTGRSEPVRLTPLEAKLLGLLMVNANQVMSKARLQELIWGYQNDSSGDLLKTHIRHLRVKLEASPSLPTFIQTINGIGYTFVLPRTGRTGELSLATPAVESPEKPRSGDLMAGVPAASDALDAFAGRPAAFSL